MIATDIAVIKTLFLTIVLAGVFVMGRLECCHETETAIFVACTNLPVLDLARDKWIFRRTTKIANIVVRRTTWIAAGSVTRQRRSSYFGVRF